MVYAMASSMFYVWTLQFCPMLCKHMYICTIHVMFFVILFFFFGEWMFRWHEMKWVHTFVIITCVPHCLKHTQTHTHMAIVSVIAASTYSRFFPLQKNLYILYIIFAGIYNIRISFSRLVIFSHSLTYYISHHWILKKKKTKRKKYVCKFHIDRNNMKYTQLIRNSSSR